MKIKVKLQKEGAPLALKYRLILTQRELDNLYEFVNCCEPPPVCDPSGKLKAAGWDFFRQLKPFVSKNLL